MKRPLTRLSASIALLSLVWTMALPAALAENESAAAAESEISVQVLKASLSKTEEVCLSLEEALQIADEQNPLVKVSEDNIQQARARYQVRLAELLPDMNLSFQESSIAGLGNIFAGARTIGHTLFIPQMLFTFPVFQGGKKIFPLRAARKSYEAEIANSENTRQQTLQQTALAYYELKRALEVISISQKQLEESQLQLDINKSRMEVGVGTRLDYLQSESQLAQSRQQLLESVKNAEVAALRLNEILNLPAISTVIPAETGQQMLTLVPPDTPMPRIIAMAEAHRPDLISIEKQIESLKELRKLVWSAFLPEVNLQSRTGAIGGSLDRMARFSVNGYTASLNWTNMALPAVGLYKQNTAQISALQHQLEAQRNTIIRELSETVLQAQSKRSQVAVARVGVNVSEQAMNDAVERLQAGVGHNIDVLNAVTTLTRARSTLSATILEYNQAQVNLISYMGLGSVESLTQGIKLP